MTGLLLGIIGTLRVLCGVLLIGNRSFRFCQAWFLLSSFSSQTLAYTASLDCLLISPRVFGSQYRSRSTAGTLPNTVTSASSVRSK